MNFKRVNAGKENLQNENLQKENLQKENLQNENLQKENLQKKRIFHDIFMMTLKNKEVDSYGTGRPYTILACRF
ncbi:hypothetical protein DU34_10050 [Methanosarcina mazei]|uniref:Pentapeptide repeat-containing protein n=1 Tax=Methanosarcina mazei TaxID=2209 RepID=A0A0F8FEC8_METMZ|nr:hypothetical protein DU34_10050 [Methanosarcina mazei]